jgi:NAD(P)-dependent dehydrogenase (short-subunit alcohol dehydrogenase family)
LLRRIALRGTKIRTFIHEEIRSLACFIFRFVHGPLKRLGRPEEIAEAILFIASDKASFISGTSIPVNGGKAAL